MSCRWGRCCQHHKLQSTRVRLGEQAQVLRRAVRLVQWHLAAGQLLRHHPTTARCSSRWEGVIVPGYRLGHTLRHGPKLRRHWPFSGSPTGKDKIRNDYITPAVLGAHMWAKWLHNPCLLKGLRPLDKNGQHWPLQKCHQRQSFRAALNKKKVLGGMFARCTPSACPAHYLCIKHLISSPKFILTLGSPPSRPH